MNRVNQIYRKLKGIRMKKTTSIKSLTRSIREKNSEILEEKENNLITQTYDKTQLRKVFEELTQRNGPYRKIPKPRNRMRC
ncbi:hypothetical protein [[Eubacterium] cellulosolvens]